MVVKKQHIAPAAEHRGQRDAQVGLVVLRAVVRLVIEVEAVAAPVQRQGAGAGAVESLTRPEAEAHSRAAGGEGDGGRGDTGGDWIGCDATEGRFGFAENGIASVLPADLQRGFLNNDNAIISA